MCLCLSVCLSVRPSVRPSVCLSVCPFMLKHARYRRLNEGRGGSVDSGRFGKSNISDPVKAAIDWLQAQGACGAGRRFDRNSGRKCFARLTRHLQLEYPHIFQVIGDLEKHVQSACAISASRARNFMRKSDDEIFSRGGLA